MCGIAGKISFGTAPPPASGPLMERMAAAIRHRGPDEFGAYADDHAAMVSTRLSIVDVATGQQPISNESGEVWIVFNGEIFNYVELRKELESSGHRFTTASDTEVIVHAFEEWGDGCFERFNGQWSIALWDSRRRILTLCRDRVGIRPLFVCRAGPSLWFGSEVKAIFADQAVPRALDPIGFDQTFTFWAPVAPRTVFQGIEEIRPGTFRSYAADGAESETVYWEPAYRPAADDRWDAPCELTLDEAAEELEARLRRATDLRVLRSDVPVGSYLSGGLDSSLIAYLGRGAKQGEFRTYSVRFEDAEYDESAYQHLMAETLECTHVELQATKKDIALVFPDVVRHAERPLLRTAPAPLFLLSRAVRESGIKAVLTGEGADEVLAGYDLFREAKIREFWAREPKSQNRPRLFERLYPYLARSPRQTKAIASAFWRTGLSEVGSPEFSHLPRWSSTASLKRFFGPALREGLRTSAISDLKQNLPKAFASWSSLGKAQYLELMTLFSGYIISSQGDRMLMAHSVEGRFPFLDRDVLEFCHALPTQYMLRLLDEKHILKKVARGKVPPAILGRPKQPYRAPDAMSFLVPGAPDYVEQLFGRDALDRGGIIDSRLGRAVYEKCRRIAQRDGASALMSNADNMAFVGILSSQLLHSIFIEQDSQADHTAVHFQKRINRMTMDSRKPAGGTHVVR